MKFWHFNKDDYVVIIIHGLQNKPPRRLLKKWCVKAVSEGFKRGGLPKKNFTLEFVYWAHHLYQEPLNPNETREGHPLFLSEPYAPGGGTAATAWKITPVSLLRSLAQKTLDRIFLVSKIKEKADALAEDILAHSFPDLALYYSNKRVFNRKKGVRDLLRGELTAVLRDCAESEILLIAHSMGSIVAYDVLQDPSLSVDILITIGSPLGSPVVRKRFAEEYGLLLTDKDRIPAPESVRSAWYNLADIKDFVAFEAKLTDHYKPNSRGIAPKDIQVTNDYEFEGIENHHNIFGYLRSKELAEILHEFVNRRRPSFFERIKKFIS
jgi:pimeloyl-ACP methyl ester carboxylesterase